MTPQTPSIVHVAVEYYPATTAAVPAVRAATVRHLHLWCLDASAVESAELVVTELASNAAKISRGEGVMALRMIFIERTLTLEVWDASAAPPALVEPNADDESGRGLLLVDALSSRWSWYRPRGGGKVVWAQLPVDEMQPMQPPAALTSTVKLEQRIAGQVPDPLRPVAFEDDPVLLRRVADRLRALDDWHSPDPRSRPSLEFRSVPAQAPTGLASGGSWCSEMGEVGVR